MVRYKCGWRWRGLGVFSVACQGPCATWHNMAVVSKENACIWLAVWRSRCPQNRFVRWEETLRRGLDADECAVVFQPPHSGVSSGPGMRSSPSCQGELCWDACLALPLLLFLQRQLCVLDYVWPAVDAFLRVGVGGDLITVLPNCRSVCMGVGRECKESKLENLVTLTALSA